jgi:hypothetical protein
VAGELFEQAFGKHVFLRSARTRQFDLSTDSFDNHYEVRNTLYLVEDVVTRLFWSLSHQLAHHAGLFREISRRGRYKPFEVRPAFQAGKALSQISRHAVVGVGARLTSGGFARHCRTSGGEKILLRSVENR